MHIYLSLGHAIYKNGDISSASGFVNEYKYNKELIEKIAKKLKNKGHKVDIIKCPEKEFTCPEDEEKYKLKMASLKKYDIGVELHLNSYDGKAKGAETLYYPTSTKGKKLATCIQNRLKKEFTDRGIKERPGLYMLRKTSFPMVLVESFFCDNKEDCNRVTKDRLAQLIANGIHEYTTKANE